MKINCNDCNAKYEIELLETKGKCLYTCMFCNSKIFESENLLRPIKILNFPKKGIAVPGMIRVAINSYMNDYRSLLDSYDLFLCPQNEPIQDWTELHLCCEKNSDDIIETGSIVLRIIFNHSENIILLTNILVSGIFKYQGIGKKLISLIFEVCKITDYRLLLVQVVESFYEKMKKRGATCIDFETIEITEQTNLELST